MAVGDGSGCETDSVGSGGRQNNGEDTRNAGAYIYIWYTAAAAAAATRAGA